jgi:imidazole glycerol-phosphate synthase subunit HisH
VIVVVDYGMGNLASVVNAVRHYTNDVKISSEPGDITSADKIILPGVGAFEDACSEISSRGLSMPILDFVSSGKPFLGICLGLQLLFSKSYEDGEHKGLDIIKGDVIRFPVHAELKVPHMGWNELIYSMQPAASNNTQCLSSSIRSGHCPLLAGITEGAYMYFVHSYYVVPKDISIIAAVTDYGIRFCSMIHKDNIYAVQFHPEKSQKNGLKVIENFVGI